MNPLCQYNYGDNRILTESNAGIMGHAHLYYGALSILVKLYARKVNSCNICLPNTKFKCLKLIIKQS